MLNPSHRFCRALATVLAVLAVSATPAAAANFETPATHAVLIDHETGTVLLEKNADEAMPPASMSKLMTVYMLLERLADGALGLDDTFAVSKKAWRMAGSKMFVLVDARVTVGDLLRGIIVQSGNDACVVVAEGLGADEEAFARQMTERAGELGLTGSNFVNATGWPHPDHYMTARDIATLSRRLIDDFPQYYSMFSETEFTYAEIRQGNRNPLLYKDLGVDGLKTGHTEASGYGLAASAVRKGRRLILVVNGLESTRERSRESERLLDWGFREFSNYALFKPGETVTEAEVWLGESGTVPLVVPTDVKLTLGRRARRGLTATVRYTGPVPAPIIEGRQIAVMEISAPDTETVTVPLLAGASVSRLGFFGRLGAAVNYLVLGASG